MAMPDSEAKKKWVKENVLKVTFKLFREIGNKENDQAIIDYLEDKNKSEVIKAALREYIENHSSEEVKPIERPAPSYSVDELKTGFVGFKIPKE